MSRIKKGGAAVCAVSAIIAIVTSNYKDEIRTSEKGLEIIGNAESCRREPYNCPAGILTDGIGNTHGVMAGKRKSDDEIARDWVKNIASAEQCVNKYANGSKLTQGQFDAAVSITFNAGCGNMQKSTMFKMFRQGYAKQACGEFSKWVYGDGKVLPGLVKRRAVEGELCRS